jgi:hypothetical protein
LSISEPSGITLLSEICDRTDIKRVSGKGM